MTFFFMYLNRKSIVIGCPKKKVFHAQPELVISVKKYSILRINLCSYMN